MKFRLQCCVVIVLIISFILHIGNDLILSIVGIKKYDFTYEEKQIIYSKLSITDDSDINLDLLHSTYFNQQVKVSVKKDVIDFFKINMKLQINDEQALVNYLNTLGYVRKTSNGETINSITTDFLKVYAGNLDVNLFDTMELCFDDNNELKYVCFNKKHISNEVWELRRTGKKPKEMFVFDGIIVGIGVLTITIILRFKRKKVNE